MVYSLYRKASNTVCYKLTNVSFKAFGQIGDKTLSKYLMKSTIVPLNVQEIKINIKMLTKLNQIKLN